MALKQKYKVFKLHDERYELQETREPGERVRKIGIISIDRQCFKKSKKEREILKLAKLQCKIDELKK